MSTACLASSLACLGLDPSGFREIAEAEQAPDYESRGVRLHADGTDCTCPCECIEDCEEDWLARNAWRFPNGFPDV